MFNVCGLSESDVQEKFYLLTSYFQKLHVFLGTAEWFEVTVIDGLQTASIAIDIMSRDYQQI